MSKDPRGQLEASLQWVLRYLDEVRAHPVLARTTPGQIEGALPREPPEDAEPIERIIADLDESILPGITHWNHPRFFGYFAITASAPGIAGEMLSAALNQNAMLWRTSPAATELEAVTSRWLARLTGLPPWFGVINDTASTSTLYALGAARHRAYPEGRTLGLSGGPPMAVYASAEAHSSVDKAVAALGIGLDNLREIPTDGAYRMDSAALSEAISGDVSRGVRPAAVVATVGTTAATAVDPLPEIARVCEEHRVWLHVDAAYAGVAAALPEYRWIFEGAGRADSIVINPHKWLFVPIDLSLLYLREPERTREAFSVVPDYLRTAGEVTNLMDYGIALGRRFRALKLWMVMRAYGARGIREAIAEHIRLARLLASWVESEPGFELLAPVTFSVVNFRWAPAGGDSASLDEINALLAERVNATGEAFLTTASIGGRLALHAAVGNLGTTEDDVRALWEAVRSAAGGLG